MIIALPTEDGTGGTLTPDGHEFDRVKYLQWTSQPASRTQRGYTELPLRSCRTFAAARVERHRRHGRIWKPDYECRAGAGHSYQLQSKTNLMSPTGSRRLISSPLKAPPR